MFFFVLKIRKPWNILKIIKDHENHEEPWQILTIRLLYQCAYNLGFAPNISSLAFFSKQTSRGKPRQAEASRGAKPRQAEASRGKPREVPADICGAIGSESWLFVPNHGFRLQTWKKTCCCCVFCLKHLISCVFDLKQWFVVLLLQKQYFEQLWFVV